MFRFWFVLMGLVMIYPVDTARGQHTDTPFSQEQEAEIENIVRELLKKNPEMVVEAVYQYKASTEERQREILKKSIADNANLLFRNKKDPVLGNPKGDITIVEFFDYRCVYCRKMFVPLMEFVEKDGRIKLVMKEFAVLGKSSEMAARGALAAHIQGKYAEFHRLLMTTPGDVSLLRLEQIGQELDMDIKKMRRDMYGSDVTAQLREVNALSHDLKITGTPSFVVGDSVYSGAMPVEQLQKLVTRVRQEKRP